MTIKVWSYLEEYETEREEILAAVDRVFKSGVLILGSSVDNFEKEFAKYCGANYGVGVDNATNGLFLALKSLGIGTGDEVITVSNTAVPTVSAIVSAGATPVFVDVEEDTALLDVNKVEAKLTEKTKCILPVHLFGQCVDISHLKEVIKGKKISIVEDCSQAHGARHNNELAGSMGDAGVFSFYPTKPLGAYGDGGVVLTNSEEVDKKLRRLRFYGMSGQYYADEHGYNSRLDEVQAEILRVKLRKIDAYISARQSLATRYIEILSDTSLKMLSVGKNNTHIYYVFVVRHPDRDMIIRELKNKDIFVNISYPWPIHTMKGYSYLGWKDGDLPVTEKLSKEIFSLPMYPCLTIEQQNAVCSALSEILGEKIDL